jgi:hypothetical protein
MMAATQNTDINQPPDLAVHAVFPRPNQATQISAVAVI